MTGHALLREYAKANGMTPAALARAVDRPGPLVWMWLNDQRIPNRDNALHLERFTNGAVRVCDWPTGKRPSLYTRPSSTATKCPRKSEKRGRDKRSAPKSRDSARRSRVTK